MNWHFLWLKRFVPVSKKRYGVRYVPMISKSILFVINKFLLFQDWDISDVFHCLIKHDKDGGWMDDNFGGKDVEPFPDSDCI